MRPRPHIRVLAACLAIAGVAGGAFTFVAHRRAEAALVAGSAVSAALERIVLTVADAASAQQAYVAPGQPDQPWLERSTVLLRQLAEAVAAVRPRLRSADAASAMGNVEQALQALTTIDDTARADITEGQSVLAADLIFNEGRDAAATLAAGVRAVQAAELTAWASERARAERQEWLALGGVALAWTAGLVILLRLGAAAGAPIAAPATVNPPVASIPSAAEQALPAPDFTAVADVCALLARVSDTPGLRSALERAATVLDARGFVVWMGAGEELFPVFAHGYDDRLLRRLGPIARSADNATADAWRSGQMRAVIADVSTHGAIVAPMATPAGCVGVLAAEVRRGREIDPATRAMAVMIAAQLAGVVTAWPSASSAPQSPAATTSGAL